MTRKLPAEAPRRITVYEVGPRDGLQNEAAEVPLEQKAELIGLLAQAHPSAIEATSFVRPDRIPQLADADALAELLRDAPFRVSQAADRGVPLSGLAPNRRGYERLRAGGLDQAAVFLSASEGHNQANLQRSVEASLEQVLEVLALARADGLPARAYLSTAFGCPYEGEVPAGRVLELLRALHAGGATSVVLGDTIGVADPAQVRALCAAAAAEVPPERIGLHMHDTYGTALANVLAGWETGVAAFDGAVGGTGGCPYAPGAAGNLATEDLVCLFERMGIATGVDLAALVRAGRFLESVLGRRLPGRALRALAAGA